MPFAFRDGEEVYVPYVAPEEWPLPPPARLFWRLPIIRHIRFVALAWRVAAWNSAWLSVGYVPDRLRRPCFAGHPAGRNMMTAARTSSAMATVWLALAICGLVVAMGGE